MFTPTTDVYGLITLLLIPILWSIYTSLSHPFSKLDAVEFATSSERKPRTRAEEGLALESDYDSDLTTITGGTYNNDDDDATTHPVLHPRSHTQTSKLQFSEVLVIFERVN